MIKITNEFPGDYVDKKWQYNFYYEFEDIGLGKYEQGAAESGDKKILKRADLIQRQQIEKLKRK